MNWIIYNIISDYINTDALQHAEQLDAINKTTETLFKRLELSLKNDKRIYNNHIKMLNDNYMIFQWPWIL